MSNPSTYKQLAAEAEDASTRAENFPSASNHRRAASKHLAAAVHAKALGMEDEMEMHDQKADEHISSMKCCDA